MIPIDINEIKKDDRVYYIPDHLEKIPENAEEGHISTIKDDKVWVRYRGPQGNLTPVKNLYK